MIYAPDFRFTFVDNRRRKPQGLEFADIPKGE